VINVGLAGVHCIQKLFCNMCTINT